MAGKAHPTRLCQEVCPLSHSAARHSTSPPTYLLQSIVPEAPFPSFLRSLSQMKAPMGRWKPRNAFPSAAASVRVLVSPGEEEGGGVFCPSSLTEGKNDVPQGRLLPPVSFRVMWHADHVPVPSPDPCAPGPPSPASAPSGTVSTTDSGAASSFAPAPQPRRGSHAAAHARHRPGSCPAAAAARPAASPQRGRQGQLWGHCSPSARCGLWPPALTSRLLWRGEAAEEDAFLPRWSPWDPANGKKGSG